MSSIRSRLTAYILTGLIALLLLAGFFIEHLIRVRLSAEFDESLLAKARLLVTLTEQEPDKIEFDFDSDVMLEYSRNDAPEYFQLQARDGKIILVSDADPASTGCTVQTVLPVPTVHAFVTPLVYAVPVQLIAYHTAVFMGTDVDQPRNLAKSVTVE